MNTNVHSAAAQNERPAEHDDSVATKTELARKLIAARDAHILAVATEYQTRRAYIAAETEYLQIRNGEDNIPAVMIDGHVISAQSEWWDRSEGSRLEFRAVEVLV